MIEVSWRREWVITWRCLRWINSFREKSFLRIFVDLVGNGEAGRVWILCERDVIVWVGTWTAGFERRVSPPGSWVEGSGELSDYVSSLYRSRISGESSWGGSGDWTIFIWGSIGSGKVILFSTQVGSKLGLLVFWVGRTVRLLYCGWFWLLSVMKGNNSWKSN